MTDMKTSTEDRLMSLQDTIEKLTAQNRELITKLNLIPRDEQSDILAEIRNTSDIIVSGSEAITEISGGLCSNCGYFGPALYEDCCPACGGQMMM